VDLFPTIAEIADVDLAEVLGADGAPVVLDGTSLVPYLRDPTTASAREVLYTEHFFPNGNVPRSWHDRMVRDANWKLVRNDDGAEVTEELYRFQTGVWDEGDPIVDPDAEATGALLRLQAAMRGFMDGLP